MPLYLGRASSNPSSILSVQLSDVSIVNTTEERQLTQSTVIIPAYSLSIGDCFEFRALGLIETSGTVSSTFKIYLNDTPIISSTSPMPNLASGSYFDILFFSTIRELGTSGSIIGQGRTFIKSSGQVSTPYSRGLVMNSTATINTRIDNTVKVTYQWATASVSNNLKTTNAVLSINRI